MKSLISILLSLICLSLSYAGGVSVGNGAGKKVIGINLTGTFANEHELLRKAKITINEIHTGTNARVNAIENKGLCQPGAARVRQLDFDHFFYAQDLTKPTPMRNYFGYLSIELSKCRKLSIQLGEDPLLPLGI